MNYTKLYYNMLLIKIMISSFKTKFKINGNVKIKNKKILAMCQYFYVTYS